MARDTFRKRLWRELWKAGLIPEPARYRTAYAEVMRLGKVEHREIRARVGRLTWWRGLVAVGQVWPTTVQRILGWGRLLTEYFIAPVPLADAQRDSIARLGALENLIVTLYDSLVDWQGAGPDVLPRATLELAANGGEPCIGTGSNGRMPIASMFLTRLTAEYFSRLNHLSNNSRNRQVRNTVGKSILAMYDAERILLSGERSSRPMVQRRMLLRTSACPFVVMGLPAWLAVAQIDSVLYAWHLRWLYRLGEFCVWVDHAVDWDRDISSGRSNLVVNELSTNVCESQAMPELAYRIAHEGARLVDEWEHRVKAEQPLAPTLHAAIQVCVASWFGGMRG